ncbi:MAG TPA: hypothetical protein EYQ18_22155, partial [Candidatus Handelsmanbacteria bacterium]|nr:hypothetical protein [Candidatus Handelsmanbacteria bacterium]
MAKIFEAAASQGDDPMMQSFFVGNFCNEAADQENVLHQMDNNLQLRNFSSPFMDLERNLALLLGNFNHTLYKSLALGLDEHNASKWIAPSTNLLKGGLANDCPLASDGDEKVEVAKPAQNVDAAAEVQLDGGLNNDVAGETIVSKLAQNNL